jgi:hypothetical protein
MRINNIASFVLAVVGVILILCEVPDAAAQTKSVGAKYGTREPAKCADMTKPTGRAPTNEQALQYVKCSMEKESSGTLYLVQDVTVQVAPKGRRYNPLAPIPNVDTNHLIFDIRGSLLLYSCNEIYASRWNAGKNCITYNQPKAQGACWKTTFGDWFCHMTDSNTREINSGVAPLQ